MRNGTWTETGGGSGGGGFGLIVAAFVGAGIWLSMAHDTASKAPAVKSAPTAPAREAVAVQASQDGHGASWWVLVVACALLVLAFLAMAGLLLVDRRMRRRLERPDPAAPAAPALPDDRSVIHLSDFASDRNRRQASGGEGA